MKNRFLNCIRYIWILLCLIFLAGCSKEKPQLSLFVWSEYLSQELIRDFERQFDCRVVIDTFETNEAMYAKLKFGATGYDIIMPSNYIFETMVEQKMLHQLDFDAIPNLRNLRVGDLEKLKIPLTNYGVPYMLSYTGIGCRPDRIEDFVPSWRIYEDKKLRGRMTMLNDSREALGAALLTLGYSVNSKSQEELNEAVELILSWKGNLAKFDSEQYKMGLASAEFLVSQGYNGDILQVSLEEQEVTFVMPKEGVLVSIDYFAVPVTAPHPELAQAFINYFLNPPVATQNSNVTKSGNLVKVDYDVLLPELQGNKTLYPELKKDQKVEVLKNLGPALKLYIKAWERVLTE